MRPPGISLRFLRPIEHGVHSLAPSKSTLGLPKKLFWSWSQPATIDLPNLDWGSQPTHALKCGASYYDPLSYLRTEPTQLDRYIAQEQRASDAYFRTNRSSLKRARSNLHSYLNVTKIIPPVPDESYGFAYWTESTAHGPAYWRRPVGGGPALLLLDPRSLPRGHTITRITMSPSHDLIGYLVESPGCEFGCIHVQYLTSSDSVTQIPELPVMGFEFISDYFIAYTVCDERLQPSRVYIGDWRTPSHEHRLIWQCPTSFIDLGKSKDSKYLTINASTLTSSEVRVIPVSDPLSSPVLISEREEGHQYFVDHHNDRFFILTTADGAIDGKVVVAPSLNPTRPHWKDLIVPDQGDKIEDVDIFDSALVLYMRRQAECVVMVYPLPESHRSVPAQPYEIPIPKGTTVMPGSNKEFRTSSLRMVFQHPFNFDATRVWDMNRHQFLPSEQQQVPRFDQSDYTISQLWVPSRDTHSQIPVTLLHRRGLILDHSHPVLIRVYGAYGVCLNPVLRLDTVELLKRGWVVALAHVRGGSELGRKWHMDGRLEHKLNSFNDLIDVGQYLIDRGYTHPNRLVASGHSAGGMTVSAAGLMRPDLFRGIVLHAPFVDVLGSMLDPNLPLTEGEYVEWGDPGTSKSIHDLQMKYSPYEQVLTYLKSSMSTKAIPRNWPDMYITGGRLDQRTPVWQVAKFAAGYRHLIAKGDMGAAEVILSVDDQGTHFGNANDGYSTGQLESMAREIVFLEKAISKGNKMEV